MHYRVGDELITVHLKFFSDAIWHNWRLAEVQLDVCDRWLTENISTNMISEFSYFLSELSGLMWAGVWHRFDEARNGARTMNRVPRPICCRLADFWDQCQVPFMYSQSVPPGIFQECWFGVMKFELANVHYFPASFPPNNPGRGILFIVYAP